MIDRRIISVHVFRRTAREQERKIQRSLDFVNKYGGPDTNPAVASEKDKLHELGVPSWANGVKVERAGFFQWAVVATENKGT